MELTLAAFRNSNALMPSGPSTPPILNMLKPSTNLRELKTATTMSAYANIRIARFAFPCGSELLPRTDITTTKLIAIVARNKNGASLHWPRTMRIPTDITATELNAMTRMDRHIGYSTLRRTVLYFLPLSGATRAAAECKFAIVVSAVDGVAGFRSLSVSHPNLLFFHPSRTRPVMQQAPCVVKRKGGAVVNMAGEFEISGNGTAGAERARLSASRNPPIPPILSDAIVGRFFDAINVRTELAHGGVALTFRSASMVSRNRRPVDQHDGKSAKVPTSPPGRDDGQLANVPT